MSFNLTDSVSDHFSDHVMDVLGNIIGGSDAQNKLAISSAIPGILSGFINIGASEKGAVLLFDAINEQDDSILDRLNDFLDVDKQSSMYDVRTKTHSRLFGEGSIDNLINAVSDYSGTNKSRTGYLIGIIVPIILGVIKRKLLLGIASFDITSQTNMLNGQKEKIVASMPFGFSDELESSGFDTINLALTDNKFKTENFNISDLQNSDMKDKLDISDFDTTNFDFIEEIKVTADNVIHKKQEATKNGKSIFARLFLLTILVGASFLAFDNFFKGSTKFTNSGQMQTLATDRLSQEIKSALGNLTKTFASITDLNSAYASLSNLSTTMEKLGGLAGKMDKLPEETRKPITQIVKVNIPQLQGELNKLGTIPGVDEILKPALENLSIKLAMFK